MARIKTCCHLTGAVSLAWFVFGCCKGRKFTAALGAPIARARPFACFTDLLDLPSPPVESVLLANFRRRSPNERLLVLVRGVAVRKKGARARAPSPSAARPPRHHQRHRPATRRRCGAGRRRSSSVWTSAVRPRCVSCVVTLRQEGGLGDSEPVSGAGQTEKRAVAEQSGTPHGASSARPTRQPCPRRRAHKTYLREFCVSLRVLRVV